MIYYLLGITTGLIVACLVAILYTRNQDFLIQKTKNLEKLVTPKKEAKIVDMESVFKSFDDLDK